MINQGLHTKERIKLLMNYDSSKTLNENYDLLNNKDIIFDFVLTEDNKYLIMMDQVFVNGGDGKSIGSIWENSNVFNEIFLENFIKKSPINESIDSDFFIFLNNITWDKTLVSECLKTIDTINEQEESLWDRIKSKVSDTSLNMVKAIFKKGVLPFLRWVRRSAYTDIGIVVDVVVSILALKTNAAVWGLIVLLDIYEIATNDFDPNDPDRKEMPYILILGDVLSFLFSGAVGAIWKRTGKSIMTKGLKNTVPKLIPYLEKIGEKIPFLKNSLNSFVKTLSEKMGSSGVISTIMRSIDNVLSGLLDFIQKLFSREGLKATITGGAVLGAVKGLEKGIESYTTKREPNEVSPEDAEAAKNKLIELGFIE